MNGRPIPPRDGFSLIEILAAISILAVLALIIVQITGAITQTIAQSNRSIRAATQARLAFDRIGLDLEALVKRSDSDLLAQNSATGSGSSLLLFVSSVTSAASSSANNRGISIIAYQVSPHADNQNRPCLLRSGQAIPWTNAEGFLPQAGFMGLLPATGLPPSFTLDLAAFLPKPGDFDVLAEGVIRMVVGFQLYPDNRAATLADGTAIANARGQIVYSPPIRSLAPRGGGPAASFIDVSRISSLVVGLVALDLPTLQHLDSSQITTLANAFPVPANQLPPLRSWSPIAENAVPNTNLSAVPLPARQSVRVYERLFPVTPFPSRAL